MFSSTDTSLSVQVELELLSEARTLLGQVVAATSSGKLLLQPPAPETDEAPADAKAGKVAKAAKPKTPAKNAAAAPTSAVESSTDDVEISCEVEAWHVDVLFRARVLVRILDLLRCPAVP